MTHTTCRDCDEPTSGPAFIRCRPCHAEYAGGARAARPTLLDIDVTTRHARVLGVPLYRTARGELPRRIA